MDHILLGVICIAMALTVKVFMDGRKEVETAELKILDCQKAAEICQQKTKAIEIQIQQEQEGIPALKEEVKDLEKKLRTLETRAKFWDVEE